MIVDDQSDALSNRMQEFEEKLAQLEQAMLTLCSRTEEKIDRVIQQLNLIHDRIVNPRENLQHRDVEIDSDEESEDDDKENDSDGGSDYETASVDLSDEAER
ncbi:homeobox protein prospero-like isoform X2 [Culicoides brevitarsis]|uniref:homeobox protein prospero-like isoform X2 n=1 Tax=Culicoides brevitarsis TaxID=469753 RepID=UPI00307CC317